MAAVTFKTLLNITGLSTQDAANYLSLSKDTIQSYAVGRRTPPQEVLDKLTKLIDKIERIAKISAAQANQIAKEQGTPAEAIELAVRVETLPKSCYQTLAVLIHSQTNVAVKLVPPNSTLTARIAFEVRTENERLYDQYSNHRQSNDKE